MAYIYDWVRMTSVPASNDLVAMIDVSDKAMSADGTNKVLEGKYLVTAADGVPGNVNGGGTISLAGYTFTIAANGTLDLGGNTVATDSNVSIVGAVLTYGGVPLTMTSGAEFDLGGVKLSVSGNTLAIDDVPLPQFDPNGTLNLGGSTLTGDGAGTLTFDGNAINTASVIEGTAGVENEAAAFDASGDLKGSNLIGGGLNALTLTASTAPATLEVTSSGTLDLSTNTLDIDGGSITLAGGGTINLAAQTLTLTTSGSLNLNGNAMIVSGADFTLSGGGTIVLNNNTLTVPTGGSISLNNQVMSFTGSGTIDLGPSGTFTMKPGDVTISNGGIIDLGGFTATVAKTGTVAMIDDIPPSESLMTSFVCYARSDTGHNYNSWESKGGMAWRGSVRGTQSATFVAAYNQTGAGTCFARLYDRTNSALLGSVSASTTGYNVLETAVTLPANDAALTVDLYTSSSSTYMWTSALQVDLE